MNNPEPSGANQPGVFDTILFSIRFWTWRSEAGALEWRCHLQHVTSGETSYFRDWDKLISGLRNAIETPGSASVPPLNPGKHQAGS